jgi:hypothetical protein
LGKKAAWIPLENRSKVRGHAVGRKGVFLATIKRKKPLKIKGFFGVFGGSGEIRTHRNPVAILMFLKRKSKK